MNRELLYVIEQIGREKGIGTEVLFEALESALLSASKRTMGVGENVRLTVDRRTGAIRVFAEKKVVEAVTDSKIEITLPDARRLKADAQLDDVVEVDLELRDLGRIAAQTAKQVILQRVREAERQGIFSEYKDREGTLVRGVVHRIEKRTVIVDLGRTEAVLGERDQIPGERYAPGDRVRAYLVEVKNTAKGPQVILSRSHPGFLIRLFETEIPEIAEGIVQVKGAAREPGERAKLAVASTKRDVDPIGACVGLRGTRIQVIVRELRGEKIDILEWSDDLPTLIARALSPAKVSSVAVQGAGEDRSALIVVPDNQLSLAIGKKGQNARLAARLTGLRIDVRSEGELEEERRQRDLGLAALRELPPVDEALAQLLAEHRLGSPEKIREGGVAALRAIPEIDEERAAMLVAAAEEWLAARPPAGESSAGPGSETPASGGEAGADGPAGA